MKLVQTNGNLRNALAKFNKCPSRLYVGFIIRRLREMFGTTQGILAKQSEANLSYINSVENGINNISIKKIWRVCNALHLSPDMLVSIQDNIGKSIKMSD